MNDTVFEIEENNNRHGGSERCERYGVNERSELQNQGSPDISRIQFTGLNLFYGELLPRT